MKQDLLIYLIQNLCIILLLKIYENSLEVQLRNYTVLTEGDTITIHFLNQ
jgi:hypothetical protein